VLLVSVMHVSALTMQRQMSSLHFAAQQGHSDIVRALLARGADATLRDGVSRRPCISFCAHLHFFFKFNGIFDTHMREKKTPFNFCAAK
jgi:hypothetical protein